MPQYFRALVVRKAADKKTFIRSIEKRTLSDLPEGDVLIRVHVSSLNYKDGLSCIGNPGVTRRYPHTPGIDAAGIVKDSRVSEFKSGDKVLIVSHDLGATIPGGFGEFIRVPAHWVIPLPEGLSLRESMIFGTAGLTAARSVQALINHGIKPDSGPIIVTGASGGVGSLSVALLSHLNYTVFASTGKADAASFLKELGASEVVHRKDFEDQTGRPYLKETWAGGVDSVGGNTLTSILRSCKEGAGVAATGMVSSSYFSMSIYPFILRGVSLYGIYAQGLAMPHRKFLWEKLANQWRPPELEMLAVDCKLDNLDQEIDKILAGGQRGRIVVNLLP
jgi:acrylyl-CoA reductase (NADPH)